MFHWILQNLASLLVGAAVLGAASAVVAGLVRKKRQGRPLCCDGVCSGCCKTCGGCTSCKTP